MGMMAVQVHSYRRLCSVEGLFDTFAASPLVEDSHNGQLAMLLNQRRAPLISSAPSAANSFFIFLLFI